MKKLSDKIRNLDKALKSLEVAVATPPIEDRDYGGIIQAFVSVYELTWRTLKLVLEVNGIQVPFPRLVFEEAFKANLLAGNTEWKEMMEDRNLSMHTYERDLAVNLCAKIKTRYLPVMKTSFVKIRDATKVP